MGQTAARVQWTVRDLEVLPQSDDAYYELIDGELFMTHYLARLTRKTLCYSKCLEMLKHSIRLLFTIFGLGMFLFLPEPSCLQPNSSRN